MREAVSFRKDSSLKNTQLVPDNFGKEVGPTYQDKSVPRAYKDNVGRLKRVARKTVDHYTVARWILADGALYLREISVYPNVRAGLARSPAAPP